MVDWALNIFSLKKGAIIKIIYWCNHKCSFCHERDNIASLDFRSLKLEDLDEIYTWLQENAFDYVILSGWEPTLHPKLVDCICYFQEKNIYVVIVNNGTHLHTHDFSRVDPSKVTFYVSYHGQKEDYNEITGSSDYEKVTQNIKELSLHFPEVILRYVVNTKNLASTSHFVDEALELSPKVYLEFILPEDLKYEHVREVSISIKDYHLLLLKFINNDRIFFDGWAGCLHPKIFEKLESKFDPLVNTMVWLVKKDKSGIIYNIKTRVSPSNIKSSWKKCSACPKNEYCHWFDISYLGKYKHPPASDNEWKP